VTKYISAPRQDNAEFESEFDVVGELESAVLDTAARYTILGDAADDGIVPDAPGGEAVVVVSGRGGAISESSHEGRRPRRR